MQVDDRRCGFVALIGAPNVGKSTLLNTMVGAKVSIVTRKVQTTRTRVLAMTIIDSSQVIFVDTPGIFMPKRRLDRAMVNAAWRGAEDADIRVILVDSARGLDSDTARILAAFKARKLDAVLALNKIDMVKKTDLLALAARLNEQFTFAETFMISALDGDGVGALRDHLVAAVPSGPWLYPEDQLSDMPMRLMAAEITREKLYEFLHQELPYAASVETESWSERKDGSIRIEQIIFVEREGQKRIVLGKGGSMIKRIGQAARMELEGILERKVHLFLLAKVRENWGDDRERYRNIGLDFVD